MKKIFYLLFVAAFFASCSSNVEVKVTVENPSDFNRAGDMVEIPASKLEAISLKDGEAYVVKDAQGNVLPSQFTYDHKLIFQSGLDAKQSGTFTIAAGAKQDFPAKTYGRLITERKDDFAWENNRTAFRIYGEALMATDGPSNGIDIWYKRTEDLVIDKWYKGDLENGQSYHEDHGEGLDDYKVGRSLGGGAMAPYVDGKLILNENFTGKPEVLENGPLRTTVRFMYKDITVNGKTFAECRQISIDADAQYTKVTQEYGTTEPMKVAAGIADRNPADSTSTIANNEFVIYREASAKAGDVFVGLLFPNGMEGVESNTYTVDKTVDGKPVKDTYSHMLGITTYQPNTPLVYYTGYGWSKFGFANQDEFAEYTERFAKSLKEPLIIKY
ncbi:DUF4861 family protein [Dysgonomonas sp. 520]|uniref:DUF4861 family protein n=1 Tax=Dysgonomonas sp. 520 TaxID=2302931 RepID=UPI0013D496E3|nr:DUF4861 family protein [Dysgonomonas sp. 520]NDW10087.1 DUF4861 domain-containing protein [Dysgonomonas sp. 520]